MTVTLKPKTEITVPADEIQDEREICHPKVRKATRDGY
jgi:hypothetical protein